MCLIKLPKAIHGGKVPCMLPPPGTTGQPATGEEQINKYHGAQCWVAGWGHTFYNGQSSDTPRSVGVNLLKNDYCIKHTLYPDTGDLFSLQDDVFCAGIPHDTTTKKNSQGNHVTRAGADSCKGDSGGPLVCDIDGTLTLMGIVSKGRMCNKEGFPGIYTNIQVFRTWLDEKKAYIWSEWGSCNTATCLQRRKRKCVEEGKCPELVETGIDSSHADYIGAGWEKFERKCMDEADCFADVTAVEAGTDPMAGLQFCDFDHARLRRSADNDTQVIKTSRVYSGTAVDGSVAKMPWVVRLEFTPETGDVVRCAGTVVQKNLILTTQDCCKSGNTVQIFYNDYVIGTADSSEFSKTGPSSEGKEDGTCFIKAHTDLSTNDDDGTISSIEKKIPCLMSQDITVDELQGYRCWSVGWGKTTADGSGDYSNQLLSAGVSLMKRDYCLQHSLYDGTTDLASNQYCAGAKPKDSNNKNTVTDKYLTSTGGAGCDGDNGGPLVCDVHGVATLVGIQNGFHAANCGAEGYPTKYLDISNLEILTQLKCREKGCANNSGCYLNKNNEATCLCTPAWTGDRCETKAAKSTGFMIDK